MAANYLHGPETIEVENGARPVKTVKSAVIGLIGTAPMGMSIRWYSACLRRRSGIWQPVHRLYHSAGAGCDL